MNEATRPVESVLKLQHFYIDECTFERRREIFEKSVIEYEYNYNRTITRLDEHLYRVSLQGNVKAKDDSVEIHARAVGVFNVETEDIKQKRVLISKNTVAMLFPYVRSQIILVTSQSGLPPVVLPIVNIAQMFQDEPLPGEE